jgi:hypothetical protein
MRLPLKQQSLRHQQDGAEVCTSFYNTPPYHFGLELLLSDDARRCINRRQGRIISGHRHELLEAKIFNQVRSRRCRSSDPADGFACTRQQDLCLVTGRRRCSYGLRFGRLLWIVAWRISLRSQICYWSTMRCPISLTPLGTRAINQIRHEGKASGTPTNANPMARRMMQSCMMSDATLMRPE